MSEDYTLEDAARAATRMVRSGVPRDEIVALIRSELPKGQAEEAYEIARLRSKASDRFEDPWELWFDEQGLRYATPDLVAQARAERLAAHGEVAVDVACGTGIQLAMLARSFDRAIGIELDPQRAALARRNLAAYGVEAQVITGDCLEAAIREQVGQVDVLFCDPARAPEADKRTFDGLSPGVHEVLEAWGADVQAWCFELPPMMPPERVRDELGQAHPTELEYTALGADLNRLAVYGGQAREAEVSAVTFPTGERLTDQDPAAEVAETTEVGDYLYLVDRTVLQAGLLDRLAARCQATGLLTDEHPRRTLLTGNGPSGTAFCTDYEVLATEAWNIQLLRGRLERVGAGKVTLRASIDPEDYWTVRNALEKGLEGERHVHLFNLGDEGLIVQEA